MWTEVELNCQPSKIIFSVYMYAMEHIFIFDVSLCQFLVWLIQKQKKSRVDINSLSHI